MTIFGWTSADAVLYGSIIQGLIGTIGIGWNLTYMFTKLNHRHVKTIFHPVLVDTFLGYPKDELFY